MAALPDVPHLAETPLPTPILVERRFPLDLDRSIASIRALYETAKRERWIPSTALPWASIDVSSLDETTRDAARRVWSRRAWIEYTGLLETPALLIRFCLEAGREADPKYFLTVRNTEEAWHVESFHRYANALGGYLAAPADPRWEAVFNRTLYRQALHAGQSLDAYVAVHCALEDGLELELWSRYLENAIEPVAHALLDKVVAAKRRHAGFGWLYFEERAQRLDAAARAAISHELALWVERVAFAGHHVASLSTTIDATPDVEAAALASTAGLGAVPAEEERAAFAGYLARTRERFAQSGVSLATFTHPLCGTV